MAEPRLVVEHREHLWSLLVEAAQYEHMIMCQYLYACFSLKTEPDEGLTAEQADAVARWQETLTGIAVAELFNLGYEVLLQVLTRFFTHTDETDEQLDALIHAAFGLMAGVLKPLGTALTRLPFGPESPDHTAGPAFEMYYQMGNFVPWRNAAWVLLAERAAVLSRQCADCARRDGVPATVSSAAAAAAGISEQLAGYVPQDLRPA